MSETLVLGVDFGTESVRVIIVDAGNGQIIGTESSEYPRFAEGLYCDPSTKKFRQHPLDYLEAFENSVKNVFKSAGNEVAERVRGIAVDTTGSTVCPVNDEGIPLSLLPQFRDNPNAMFYLWKDHSAIQEAIEITKAFSDYNGEDYTRFQGPYSSEWFWAKILYASRTDPIIREHAHSWVEHCDWIPALLAGNAGPGAIRRCACAAGHKAFWHGDFGGLPPRSCFEGIDPYLAQVADTFAGPPCPAGTRLGTITKEWAKKFGLNDNTVIGAGSFDAHAGAVGAGIKQGTLVKVLGTSTVDMLIQKRENLRAHDLKNFCGQAEDSIIPGYIGIEAGQASFGDIYSWFRKLLLLPVRKMVYKSIHIPEKSKEGFLRQFYDEILSELNASAMETDIPDDLIIVDWFNGRRYPFINESLKGGICGLSIGTDAVQFYKTLVLSTVFGSRSIFDSFISHGIPIDDVIVVGGIAKKSALVNQMLADVLKRPIKVSATDQACAKGTTIFAAVACGTYPTISEAQRHMCDGYESIYTPETSSIKYDKLYARYLNFGRHIEQMDV